MAEEHRAVAILPCRDLDRPAEAFYARLGFAVDSDYGDYRILSDGAGLAPPPDPARPTAGWCPTAIRSGIYLYVDDVDAVADRVRHSIIEDGAPHHEAVGDVRVRGERSGWGAGAGGAAGVTGGKEILTKDGPARVGNKMLFRSILLMIGFRLCFALSAHGLQCHWRQ